MMNLVEVMERMGKLTALGEKGKLGTHGRAVVQETTDQGLVSMGRFWMILLAMYIPTLGWFVTFFKAFKRTENANIRNLARATLINKFLLGCMVLFAAWWLLGIYKYFSMQLDYIMDLLTSLPDNPQNIVVIVDKIEHINEYFK